MLAIPACDRITVLVNRHLNCNGGGGDALTLTGSSRSFIISTLKGGGGIFWVDGFLGFEPRVAIKGTRRGGRHFGEVAIV
jgi:hypothetical protein